jgi:hypothetical protein
MMPASSKTSSSTSEDVEVLKVSSHLVPVPATVIDERGVAVANLRLEDFELTVDGQAKPISDITRAESPVRLAMLFDNSGSLDFARDFEKRAAIRFFHNVMRPMDQAAIYSVSTSIVLAQPMTSDVARLQQTIELFGKPDGATSLYDAIFDALTYLKPYQGRRVIVVVSDGRDTTSREEHDFENTLRRLSSDVCQVVANRSYDNANVRDRPPNDGCRNSPPVTGAAYIPKSVTISIAPSRKSRRSAQQYTLSCHPDMDKGRQIPSDQCQGKGASEYAGARARDFGEGPRQCLKGGIDFPVAQQMALPPLMRGGDSLH